MLNAKLAPVLLLIGVTASVWGCGDDDPAPAPPASGGKGGSAGSGGKGGAGASGKGGTAGSGGATGGASGKGGAAGKGGSAGTSGTSGTGGGGTSGTGGGGTAGTAGTSGAAGQGGEGGEPTGAGGEGGGTGAITLEQACADVCADQATVSCSYGALCEPQCVGLATDAAHPAEYTALITCQAANCTTANYENYCPDKDIAMPILAPEAGTECEDELCTWACLDYTYVSYAVYLRCGCT